MIKLTATGPIHSISPVIEIPPKNAGGTPFQKRELVIDDSWVDRENNPHSSFVVIEFTGDRMALLNQFAPQQRVSVECMVSGREHNGRVFNTIKGLNVTPYQPQAAQGYGQQPAYNPAPAPAPGYPSQPAYPNQGGDAPAPGYTQQPAYPSQGGYGGGYPQNQNLGPDGLPFR